MNSKIKISIKILVLVFALIGFVFVGFRLALYFGWTDSRGVIDSQADAFWKSGKDFEWPESIEWSHFKQAVFRDKETIYKVEKETGIKARILVSQLVVEQMRFYYSNRGWFERMLKPKNLLASYSHASWGVVGIQEETVKQVENNLKDKNSPWYLGEKFENYLDFETDKIDRERFSRITDPDDHFYAFLYQALYNKQIIAQWQKEGFDISGRPEILATLYNIGFKNSKPKADPQSGGSALKIGGEDYSFGGFAQTFYYSDELIKEFPL